MTALVRVYVPSKDNNKTIIQLVATPCVRKNIFKKIEF